MWSGVGSAVVPALPALSWTRKYWPGWISPVEHVDRPGVASGGRVLQRPARQRHRTRAAVEQLDEVMGVGRPRVATAAVHLTDDDIVCHRRRRRRHRQRDRGGSGARLGVVNRDRQRLRAGSRGGVDRRLEREHQVPGRRVAIGRVVEERLSGAPADSAEIGGDAQARADGVGAGRHGHGEQHRVAALDRVRIRGARPRGIRRFDDDRAGDVEVVDADPLVAADRVRRDDANLNDGLAGCRGGKRDADGRDERRRGGAGRVRDEPGRKVGEGAQRADAILERDGLHGVVCRTVDVAQVVRHRNGREPRRRDRDDEVRRPGRAGTLERDDGVASGGRRRELGNPSGRERIRIRLIGVDVDDERALAEDRLGIDRGRRGQPIAAIADDSRNPGPVVTGRDLVLVRPVLGEWHRLHRRVRGRSNCRENKGKQASGKHTTGDGARTGHEKPLSIDDGWVGGTWRDCEGPGRRLSTTAV